MAISSCLRAVSAAAFLPLLVAGCSLSPVSGAPGSSTAFHFNGKIHGGQQAVSGSTIQLFAANSTTNAGASTSMLTNPVTSASDGSFSITGDYTCPSSNPLVYIVARGGNPGLPGTVNNTSLAMMSLLGTCQALLTGGASTFIWIDELTTVASVQAIASFMTDYSHVGAAPSSPTALAGAFDNATSEVSFSTGQFNGGGNSQQLPEVTLNTMADVIAACINTDGSGSPCSTLLADTSSTDTITAALHIAQSPGTNTAQLYGLIPPTPPFQPYFTSVPSDFSTIIGFTLPAALESGALDSNGHLWLYTAGYSYDTVNDVSTDNPGIITVYDNNFNVLFTVSPGTGGMYYPQAMASDAAGHVFAANANNTISEFAANGSAISPAGGWSTGITSNFSPSGPGNGYITNASQVDSIQVDAQGNIWGAIPVGSSPGKCYVELSSAGTVITPTGNFCTTTGITSTATGTTDGLGDAWVAGNTTIAKVNAAGNFVVAAPVSQGCFYPRFSAIGQPNLTQAFESVTLTLKYDHVNGKVWGYSETGAGTITNAGAASFCDFGATMPTIPEYQSTATTPGSAYSAGSLLMIGGVLDGAGNFWFTTGGATVSGVVGSSPGTFTGNITYATYLGEITANGTVATPFNAATNTYGLQPSGLGTNATATGTNASVSPSGVSAVLLGVDLFGNIWAEDVQNSKVFKITGLATANTVNY